MDGVKILLLASIWPEARASGASTRVLDLATALQKAGARVTISAAGREGAPTDALRQQGLSCIRLAPNDDTFDAYVAELQPDLTIFDRFATEEKFGWRVRRVCPASLRVLDTIDLHWLRLARQRALAAVTDAPEELPPIERLWELSGDTGPRELAAIYRSDLTLVVSDVELDILIETCGVPASLLHLCRLSYPQPPPVAQPFAARSGYAMIGNFRHPPNADAVLWLKHEVWPRLRQWHPDAEIDVWGAYAQPQHLALSAPAAGFHVRGFVADQFAELGRRRVNLAPLRHGAGIKIKISDGWWCGTPAAATPIAAEGMHDDRPFGGLVGGNAVTLAEAAVRLHEDQSAWAAAALAGRGLIEDLYSAAATMGPLLERLRRLLRQPDRARQRNVTGQILWQQGLRSTEYFSRWIAAKTQPGPSP